jgi:DNA-binding GntR family transcriptional regulator
MAMKDDSTVSDRIMEWVRGQIYAGDLKPGEPLRQDHIARRFRTSKPPVREALRRLEAQDYVDFETNRGFFVKRFTRDEILNLFEMCALFEGHAMQTAAGLLTKSELKALEQCVDRMAGSTDLIEQLKADSAFHLGLIAHARNERILARVAEFHAYFHMYYRAMDPDEVPRPAETYRTVIADLKRGDIMAATARIQVCMLDEGRRLSALGGETGRSGLADER